MKIPPLIHFSLPENPTSSQLEAVKIAGMLNPGFEVRIWRDSDFSKEWLGESLAQFLAKANSGAQRADLIRLEVVQRYGGIYLDSDIILSQSLEQLTEIDHFFVAENGNLISNAVFGATPGSKFVASIIGYLLENEPDWTQQPNITTGPHLFSRVLGGRSDLRLLPPQTFMPYQWFEKKKPPHHAGYGAHLWAGSWKKRQWSRVRGLLNLWIIRLRAYRLNLRHNVLLQLAGRRRPLTIPCAGHFFVRMNAVTLKVPSDDLSVSIPVAMGYYERAESLFLQRTLRPGDHFIDVGANVGFHSVLAARRVGKMGRVFAFEPNPLAAKFLRDSGKLNFLNATLQVKEKALGASDDVGLLGFDVERLGYATLMSNSASELPKSCRQISVAITNLDSEFPVAYPIRVLKIDVEGFEAEVFLGARKLLQAQAIDFIICELTSDVGFEKYEANLQSIQSLKEFGFGLAVLTVWGGLRKKPFQGLRTLSGKSVVLYRE